MKNKSFFKKWNTVENGGIKQLFVVDVLIKITTGNFREIEDKEL